jgi:hypothetical protein
VPYAIRRGTGPRPWKIINKDRNEQVGSSRTKGQAEAAVRARYAIERGPRKKA